MKSFLPHSFTCFDGHRHLATDSFASLALVAHRAIREGAVGPVLVFDDATGRTLDLDLRGSDEEIVERLAKPSRSAGHSTFENGEEPSGEPRGRGRPKLGVIAREVTLLPRHWEWLATQPGGASVALRKLVEEARRIRGKGDKVRATLDRTYQFMSTMAGNFQGFEEASRALFARDYARFCELTAPWPPDIREHLARLADHGQWEPHTVSE